MFLSHHKHDRYHLILVVILQVNLPRSQLLRQDSINQWHLLPLANTRLDLRAHTHLQHHRGPIMCLTTSHILPLLPLHSLLISGDPSVFHLRVPLMDLPPLRHHHLNGQIMVDGMTHLLSLVHLSTRIQGKLSRSPHHFPTQRLHLQDRHIWLQVRHPYLHHLDLEALQVVSLYLRLHLRATELSHLRFHHMALHHTLDHHRQLLHLHPITVALL